MKIEKNKIYNMNCIEGMKLIKKEDFNLVVTDPPYNIKFNYNEYSDDLTEEEYIDLIGHFKGYPLAIIHYPEESMRYFVPALGVPGEVVVWCYNSNIPRQSRLINFYNCKVNFNKVRQEYKNLKDKRIQERIKKGHTGGRLYDWFSDINLVKNVSKQKKHPCPIPVELIERIILLTTNEGDTIIDPFIGSGTTAIACINTKRNFIGFEKDEFYFNIAQSRIQEHIKEKGV